MNRQWNVVAALACILVVLYAGMAVTAFLMGKVDFAGFREALLPVLMAVMGYLARMLTTNEGDS